MYDDFPRHHYTKDESAVGDSVMTRYARAAHRIPTLFIVTFFSSNASTSLAQCEVHEVAKLTASDAAAHDVYGESVSIDGNTIVVGADEDDCAAGFGCGSAYVYRFNGLTWVEEQKLTASDGAPDDRFGVAVSADGVVAVVGAPTRDCPAGPNCGSAYIYRFNGSTWVEEQHLTASDAADQDQFGASVSVSADTSIIGAPSKDCSAGIGCGAAYVYHFDGSVWVQQAEVTASDAAPDDAFGNSVSISGNTAVVGAYRSACAAGDGCGSAYVYRFNGSTWVEEQQLMASDAASVDTFGHSVSIDGDITIVGAPHDACVAGVSCGSAYAYRFNGSTWVEEQKLTASDAAANDLFGQSVSVNGDTAIVGAYFDDCAGGFDCGAAYLFQFNGSTWVEINKLTASDAASQDGFGLSVSISGNTAVVGAYIDDCTAGSDCGSVYLFPAAPDDCGATCGDSLVEGTENCDDGNTVDGDGCSSTCTIESGWGCSGAPSSCTEICGDGIVTVGEQCDGTAGPCPGLCLSSCRCTTGEVPTVSEWGLAVMALIGLAGGTIIFGGPADSKRRTFRGKSTC